VAESVSLMPLPMTTGLPVVVVMVGLAFWQGGTDKLNMWLYKELSPATTATVATWGTVAGLSGHVWMNVVPKLVLESVKLTTLSIVTVTELT
jgi:hypothetical protein